MTQKVLKVGTSAAVTIPKESLKELGLKVGDSVSVSIEPKTKTMSIRPSKQATSGDQKVARLTMRFIDRYRADLERLAKK